MRGILCLSISQLLWIIASMQTEANLSQDSVSLHKIWVAFCQNLGETSSVERESKRHAFLQLSCQPHSRLPTAMTKGFYVGEIPASGRALSSPAPPLHAAPGRDQPC